MLKFKEYTQIHGKSKLETEHPILYNFLHHLSSPTLSKDDIDLSEAHTVDHVLNAGLEAKPEGNLYHRIKNGFHDAFPENETPDVTKKKALEARAHFRSFVSERGGLAKNNKSELTGQNGKTALSSGEGMNTIGLSLTPHKSSGYKEDLCPNASTECRANCLGFTAGGNRQYPETSFRAKLLRTQYLSEHPEHAARLMSHEITENENWAHNNKSIHDKDGNIVGYHQVKRDKSGNESVGKVRSSSPKKISHDEVANKLKSGEYESRSIKSGFRGNVTSDLPYESLMPRKFFERHHKTTFYDYTKNANRLKKKDLPSNYHLALSHTGTGHNESNDKSVIDALHRGSVVAMVHQKSKITPTHVEDVQTGKRWKIVNGDKDDNVYDRHRQAGVPSTEGVVSGLKLKGVSNKAAGHFANPVDADGIIRINHPKQ